jgi:hypothetical protein
MAAVLISPALLIVIIRKLGDATRQSQQLGGFCS